MADKILVMRLVDSNAVVAFVGSSEKTMKRLQPLEGSDKFEFGFGYEGPGAHALAKAILTAALGADVAANFSADFVRDVLSVQDRGQWGITIAGLKAWLAPKLEHEWMANGRCKLCGQNRRPDGKDGPCPARFVTEELTPFAKGSGG